MLFSFLSNFLVIITFQSFYYESLSIIFPNKTRKAKSKTHWDVENGRRQLLNFSNFILISIHVDLGEIISLVNIIP